MARIKYKEAVGMKVSKGRPAIGKRPDKKDLVRFYEKELKSIRHIAGQLGLHPATIHYWLRKYDIKTRSKARKSRLLSIPLEEIERNLAKLGIRGYARKLGLSEGTIRHHLKARRS
jgi:predicted transcriptional regulator